MALFFYKEKNKDIRAAAYLRLSIEDGDKAESNSIGNQRELIRDFAAERPGLHLVEEYADDGYTGTNFERPGFKRMMEDIKSGKINCIIVKDLSRLGRNYIEMGKYLEQIFPMMGIRFIAINDNYDNANAESNDSDNIVVPFKNLLNDSYCRDISIKVRSQLDMKRRKGEFIGGYAIYGYCKDERNKNRLVVDEYAADVVRSIYRRKLEGMSAQAIAEQLNSENTLVWERALSLRNPWIQQVAQYKAPEELDRSFVKKYIEQVTVTLLGDGQAEIGLTMKTYEWKQMLGRIETEETDDGTKE